MKLTEKQIYYTILSIACTCALLLIYLSLNVSFEPEHKQEQKIRVNRAIEPTETGAHENTWAETNTETLPASAVKLKSLISEESLNEIEDEALKQKIKNLIAKYEASLENTSYDTPSQTNQNSEESAANAQELRDRLEAMKNHVEQKTGKKASNQ
ncbi:hypothetical protein TDB9533_00195 [Thalassocella blandensis]|nr:hypothetical protein TDB9533_00195 [Thalassocella blandensis]